MVKRSYKAYAYRSRSRVRRLHEKQKKWNVWSWVISVGIAVSAAFLIRAFIFSIVLVDGSSMYPTLESHERVAIEKISRYSGLPKRGNIIIVKYPNMEGTYVKRTIGLPGETLEVRDNIVYVDGAPLNEDYINTEPYPNWGPFTVPENHVVVMGDNRAHSLDSRTDRIGAIPHDQIEGHALFVIWPLDFIHNIS